MDVKYCSAKNYSTTFVRHDKPEWLKLQCIRLFSERVHRRKYRPVVCTRLRLTFKCSLGEPTLCKRVINSNELAMALKSHNLHLGPRALQCAVLTFNAVVWGPVNINELVSNVIPRQSWSESTQNPTLDLSSNKSDFT